MAERGWWGGLLDETARLPQGIAQLVRDAVTRQPRTDPTQPVVTPGPGGLLDLTPVPSFTEAYKATDDVGQGGYEGGKAIGTYLSGLLGIIPVVGAVRKAGPIRAYHGSPHSFDKFDLNKIGTGEGAQAYGHGLYFAGNEDVAKSYKRAGPAASREMDVINGQLSRIAREMDQYYGGQYGKYTDPKGYELKAQYDALMQKKMDLGHMYEVGIHADPAKMLDWDKPLTQQPQNVRDLLYSSPRMQDDYIRSKSTTGEAYSELAGTLGGRPKATEAIQQLGIPGIRYYDQGSRASAGGELIGINKTDEGFKARIRVADRTGIGFQTPTTMFTTSMPFKTEEEAARWAAEKIKGGTSNYVVFDPNIIEIMRKYGIPIAAGGAAAAAVPGLLNEEKQY